MPPIPNDLTDLSNASQQKRDDALLRATTELFLHQAGHDRDEIRRFEELATHFLPRVTVADRVFVAEKLSTSAEAPPAVIRALAKDCIDVARSVLRYSPALRSLDLLTVIAATGPHHHRLIAQRAVIEPDVERALRLMGDGETTAFLDDRAGTKRVASPPPATPTAPAEPPAPPARKSEVVLPPPRRSADPLRLNPDELSFEGFLGLDRTARLRVLADLTTRPPSRRYSGPSGRIDQAFRSILGAAQIVSFARRGQISELVTGMSEGLGIAEDVIRRALDDKSGEAFVVMLKVLGLDNVQAQQVLLLATPTIGRDVNAFFKLADVFAALESFVAESLVAAWRHGARPAVPRHEPILAPDGTRRPATLPAETRRSTDLPQKKTTRDAAG
jgi:hypothetical protein